MSILYSRNEIGEGINFTSIADSKFKTNTIRIKFITQLSEETAAANALAVGTVAASNSRYPSQTELSARINELYGGTLFADVEKVGNFQVLTFGASVINNEYTFENEDILNEMLDIIECCIFEPNISDGGFDRKEFQYRKQDVLDSIDTEINNKRSYAILRAQKTIFKNEPASYSSYGTRETAEKLTAESVYQRYLKLLETASIEIYYVGAEEKPEIMERLKKDFEGKPRNCEKLQIKAASPFKSETEKVTERFDVNQSKLVMAYKTDYENIYPIIVMNTILGGSPVSKLFANVREKMSLCYYCASSFGVSKNTLIIDSGIENENIEKTEKAVNEQLEQIKSGNISDEEMENAVLSLVNAIKSIGDTPSSYINWYFKTMCRGKIIDTDEEIKQIKLVCREQVIECAKSFVPDTVYVMTGSEEE